MMSEEKKVNGILSDEALGEVAGGGRSGGAHREMPKSKYKIGDFVDFYYTALNCDVTGEIQGIYTKVGYTSVCYTILIGCVPPGHHIFSGKCLLVSDITEKWIKGLS